MPINRQTLLTDLKRWVTRLENDLRDQCKELPELDARLKGQYDLAKKAGRTAMAYSVWRDDELTQSAVGWVLSCVFVRFLEDNDLLEKTWISGLGENRERASQTRGAYFTEHRTHSDDDYLRHAFTEVGHLPGMADLMDARHNALWNASISGDAAKEFIEFWRRIDPATGNPAHDFADPGWDTRFLGDLYQDLSESARKKFALLQTPDFVEEFILDRTLDPAIDTFGLKEVRMIDPTCGSGHFVLGGFRRLLRLWQQARPDLCERELAAHALNGVYGVDINPFAVAIARFRLLLEAWHFCGVKQLRHAPDFRVNLAVGDSLLHGARFDSKGQPYLLERQTLFGGDEPAFKDELAHCFAVEDAKELHRILGQQYHAVVGNPPYITVKDKALNLLYRKRYDSCHMQYALSVPFMERFFDLTVTGSKDGLQAAGLQGQITSNSFIKREFGKKLIEEFIQKWDITHVIDTKGAYIPGHGTPTVILFGRNAQPKNSTVRSIMGIKGEPSTPENPAKGFVWTAIVDQIDRPGSESDFVSAADTEREKFHKHPWNIGGGGAAGLTDFLAKEKKRLSMVVSQIGCMAITGEDNVFVIPDEATRTRFKHEISQPFVEGDCVRDWLTDSSLLCVWVYDKRIDLLDPVAIQSTLKRCWPFRRSLELRKRFGTPMIELQMKWWEWRELYSDKFTPSASISFAEVSTHNHFVLDRGGKVFKQTAPVIKLKPGATEEDHLRLLGLLNSSTACFWIKQVFYPKATATGDISTVKGKPEANRYQIAATGLQNFPIPIIAQDDSDALVAVTGELDKLASELSTCSGNSLTENWLTKGENLADLIDHGEQASARIKRRMIYLQEELDWLIYKIFGLIDQLFPIDTNAAIDKGDRPFCWASDDAPISLSTVLVDTYSARKKLIRDVSSLSLIETPVFKRPWLGRQGVYGSSSRTYREQAQEALRKWLLTRLEAYFFDAERMITGEDETAAAAKLAHVLPIRARFAAGGEPRLTSTRQLATAAATDSQWMEAAVVYAGRHDFEVPKLVEDLVLSESVPSLPANRYKAPGLRKRVEWERTWDLQRREDAIESRVRKEHPEEKPEKLKDLISKAQQAEVGDIPETPKYGSGDFTKSGYWKLRGKLDVPKERWILYPGAEGGHDDSPVIAWAGWDHAQQAQALAGFFQQAKTGWVWEEKRLVPLLAALKDLLPWLHQWHDEIDPRYRQKLSTIYEQFYQTERQALRMTEGDVEAVRMGDNNT